MRKKDNKPESEVKQAAKKKDGLAAKVSCMLR